MTLTGEFKVTSDGAVMGSPYMTSYWSLLINHISISHHLAVCNIAIGTWNHWAKSSDYSHPLPPPLLCHGVIFGSALCYHTAELTVMATVNMSSLCMSAKLIFSETTRLWCQVWLKGLSIDHIVRPYVLFFKILNFYFFRILLIFLNMGPYRRKLFKQHLWKYTSDSLSKFITSPKFNKSFLATAICLLSYRPYWQVHRMTPKWP